MGLTQYTTTGGHLIDNVRIEDGDVDLNGGELILDTDEDTKIAVKGDDQFDIEVGGAVDFSFTSNAMTAASASKFAGQGSTVVPMYPIAAAQTISGAGAATITQKVTKWTTTGADAGTLADGAAVGQIKKIILVVDAGDLTLTPNNLSGGTTITFADAGDWAELMWDGTNWVMIDSGNTVDGVSEPVLA
jgi:hypothetical protein